MITKDLDTTYWSSYDDLDKLSSAYSNWLVRKVKFENFENYTELLNLLYTNIFHWSVYNDDNRESEGMQLRKEFLESRFLDINTFNFNNASFLEVLIALSIRMDEILMSYAHPSDPAKYFYEIINNAGLTNFTNDVMKTTKGRTNCQVVIDYISSRSYNPKGQGGLFPLKGMCSDQRHVELWYQMSAYILENYDIVGGTDYKNL